LSNILITALTDILSTSLPDSLQSAIPGLSSITSALTQTTNFTGAFNLFSEFTFTDPTASLISGSIIGAVSAAIGGDGLASIAGQANQLLSTAQSFTGSVPAISPANALAGFGNGGFVLQNALDQAINNSIPNASMIISSTFNDVSSISSLTGSSFTETVDLTNSGAAIPYAAAAAQTFSGKETDPFGIDTHSQGFDMSNVVLDYINKRNLGAV